MEEGKLLSKQDLLDLLLLGASHSIDYNVKVGNLPPPFKIKKQSFWTDAQIKKRFGRDSLDEPFITKYNAMEILGMGDADKVNEFSKLQHWMRQGIIPYYTLSIKNRGAKGAKSLFLASELHGVLDSIQLVKDHKHSIITNFHENFYELTDSLLSLGFIKDMYHKNEFAILQDYLSGCFSTQDIAGKYGITRERARQVQKAGMNRFIRRVKSIPSYELRFKKVDKEYRNLQAENKYLRHLLSKTSKSVGRPRKNPLGNEHLGTRLVDLDLGVRTMNVLMEVFKCMTIGDVLHIKRSRLMVARNFGAKSIKELELELSRRDLKLID